MFYYSRDRRGEHPQAHLAGCAGILQADAYDGFYQPYLAGRHLDRSRKRRVGSMRGAGSSPWPISKRMRVARPPARRRAPLSPIAVEVVRRIDALFEIERSINGRLPRRASGDATDAEPASGRGSSGLYAGALAKLFRGHDLAKASNYILKRWASFTLFLEDGRVCLSNNAAERGLRGIAPRHRSWAKLLVVLRL
ncbi:IS66 family transposase [Bradyrhizobium elkanii]|uniref:IS66 family transposase n=1 Tax=Bradyrhizobium elkanii TaxID=29448 RepID=UPI0020133EDD|nr:transposase [Bradyrhizobium elkanii]